MVADQALKLFVGHNHRLTFSIETPPSPLSRQAGIKSNPAGTGGLAFRFAMGLSTAKGIK
jgi:hypothetical protein